LLIFPENLQPYLAPYKTLKIVNLDLAALWKYQNQGDQKITVHDDDGLYDDDDETEKSDLSKLRLCL